MIELYSGTPGSGKSLHSAKVIRERLQEKGRIVIGNFPINKRAIKKMQGVYIFVDNDRLTPERLIRFSLHLSAHLGRRLKEGEVLLIIDEAQLIFNSREWQRLAKTGWLSFFSQHRHLGYDIILAAQFDRMLDRQVRCLIEYEYVHRKISRAGRFGSFLGFLTRGSLFVYIKRWYPIHEKVDTTFFLGTSKLYDLYDSYILFDAPAKAG